MPKNPVKPAAGAEEDAETSLPWGDVQPGGDLENSSITSILRLQDHLDKVVRDKYQKKVAVMFTDIAGSTAYFEEHGDAAGRRMIQRHNDLLFPVVERHGGRVVKTIGDAIMASFPSAQQAVDAAIGMQRTLRDANAQTNKAEEKIHIRVGVNFGTALLNEKDGDLFGDMVNVAARIQSKAGDGQIYISETVKKHVSTAIETRASGEFTLKGKTQPFQLYEVDWRNAEQEEVAAPPNVDPRYIIVKKLGAGGMAVVWRARDERLGRDIAIKVMHGHLASGPARQRFEREAQIAAGLGHENIVQVFDFQTAEPYDSYIAMEFVDGESLRSHVEKKGEMSPGLAAAFGVKIARALAYAHGRGVIHRDVKPENVMISRDGQVKLGDFGIAGVEDTVRQTTAGVLMGTPGYLAPEQVQGQPADARTDLYALGVLLYEITTGTQAFAGESVASLMYKIVENKYVRPEAFPGMDKGLAAVINRCLAKEPKARFQSADEVAQALKTVAQKQGVDDIERTLRTYATTVPPATRAKKSGPITARTPTGPRTFPVKWVAIAAGAVVLVGVSAVVGAKFAAKPAPVVVAPPAPAPAPAPLPVASPVHVQVAPALGKVQVIAHGGWLDVSVDGKPRGRTPLRAPLELANGPHTVVVTNAFKNFKKSQTVTVRGGETTLVEIDLPAAD